MNLKRFTGEGSTKTRRSFWNELFDAVTQSQKRSGRNVSIRETPGTGTLINVTRERGALATGACCTDGECTITTRSECENGGGHYVGDNIACDSVDCSHGACCHPDGTCTSTTQETCDGAYQGDGTD